MKSASRLLLPLAATLLLLLLTIWAIFPGELGSETLREALMENHPDLWDQYRADRIREKHRQLTFFLGGLLSITVLLTAYFYAQFVRPVMQLSRQVAARDLQGLEVWSGSHGDLGRMARLLARYLRETQMMQDEIRRNPLVLSDYEQKHLLETGRLDREKLARNLHDGVIQAVYSIGLEVGAMRNRLQRSSVAVQPEDLKGIENSLRSVVRDIRGIILNLEPQELRQRDLLSALQELGKSLVRIGQPPLELKGKEDLLTALPRKLQIELYLVLREMISNAVNHAKPTILRCTVEAVDRDLHLNFWNDGLSPMTGEFVKGSGLKNIDVRLQPYRGVINFGVEDDKSFAVMIVLPGVLQAEAGSRRLPDENNPTLHRR